MATATVVIVEDNLITVRSLEKTIRWEQLGCKLIGTANDGVSGKEMIIRLKPDIVLTDIQMLNMDGLEMISQLRPLFPELVFIILTGYDQFQYASRAIKLSVFDYILKPIRNEEVESSLTRALEMMHCRQKADEVAEKADKLQAQAQLLSLLTNVSHSDQDIHAMLDKAGLNCESYYLMILQPDEEGSLPQSILNGADKVLEKAGVKACSVTLYDSIVIYIMRGVSSSDWWDDAEDLCEAFRQNIPIRLNIGVSELQSSHHMIRQTYQHAREALYETSMNANHGVNAFYQVETFDNESLLSRTREKLEQMVEKNELTEETIPKTAKELLRLSGQQYSQLRALVSLYIMMLGKKYPSNDTRELDRALSAACFVTDEEQVSKVLRQLCLSLRQAKDATDNHFSLLTKNVLDYIRIHGAGKISLSDVADKFHVSPNYLSALIRKETGITFHEQVITVKMDIAHTMLADPRILVEEVAYALGYSNYVSFYNVFKQQEHMTPTEYRNMLAKQNSTNC